MTESQASRWVGADEWLRAEPEEEHPGVDGWAALADLIRMVDQRRPAWQKDALCQEYPDISFFPEAGGSSDAAKEVCSRCLVAEPCLDYAMEMGINHGIWSGVQGASLTRMRKARDPVQDGEER